MIRVTCYWRELGALGSGCVKQDTSLAHIRVSMKGIGIMALQRKALTG